MKTYKILDNCFAHCKFSGNPTIPNNFSKNFKWNRNVGTNEDVVFYTDSFLHSSHIKSGHKKKIAWLVEPYVKQPERYEWILNNNKLYDYVLTHEKKLLERGENFIFIPHGGGWILHDNRKLNVKTKNVSIVVSGKKNVPDHYKRHELISRFKDKIDVYGRGYVKIEPIDIGIKDYKFHIAMENEQRDFYFSEKIINPILCGTIPIYYGMPSIGKYFDTRGMIIFNNINEIENIVNNLSDELYQSLLPYAKNNFDMAQEYILAEDWMYNNCFEKIGIK